METATIVFEVLKYLFIAGVSYFFIRLVIEKLIDMFPSLRAPRGK